MIDLDFKKRLTQYCIDVLEQKIIEYKKAISDAQESANAEEKSSAGDKYETGRAMSHIQGDMLAGQLKKIQLHVSELKKIDTSIEHDKVTRGALVNTNKGLLFFATAIGNISMDEHKITVLSISSPLAKMFEGKQQADSVIFNAIEYNIADVI
jgi:hypothetical protein